MWKHIKKYKAFSVIALCLTAFVAVICAAPAFVTIDSANIGSDIHLTKAHTVVSTSNILIFSCAIDNSSTATLTVDDNGGGHSATQIGTYYTQGSSPVTRGGLWQMTPPATGAITFQCTSSGGGQDITFFIAEYSGQNAITAGTPVSGNTATATISQTLQQANNIIAAGCSTRGTTVLTTSPSGTFRKGDFNATSDRISSGFADITSGSTGSQTVSFTIPGGAAIWGCQSVEIQNTGGGGATPHLLNTMGVGK